MHGGPASSLLAWRLCGPVAVAEYGRFWAAALRLEVEPYTVTDAVAHPERQLGVTPFTRTFTGVNIAAASARVVRPIRHATLALHGIEVPASSWWEARRVCMGTSVCGESRGRGVGFQTAGSPTS